MEFDNRINYQYNNCKENISPASEILTRGFKSGTWLFIKKIETHRFIKRTLSEQS